jgi:flagellar basal body rod protein FlgF
LQRLVLSESFESAMMTLKVQGGGFESRLRPQAYSSDNINMKPGVIMKTGRNLDVAMDDQAVMGATLAANGECGVYTSRRFETERHRRFRNRQRRHGVRPKR